MEEQSHRLDFVETHERLVELVEQLEGNTLITFGVSPGGSPHIVSQSG
jgi:hypothetical protein